MNNTISNIKDLVYNQGLGVLLSRMEILQSKGSLEKLLRPIAVEAKIVDMDAVVSKIKEKWHTCFNIKDVEVDLQHQTVNFRYWGGPYFVPKKYASYVIFGSEDWSPVKTEYCDYARTTKEEYAEKDSMPLSDFENNGIEIKWT